MRALVALLAVSAVAAPAALATSPGHEGRIAFTAPGFAPGSGSIFTIRPDGSDRRVLVDGATQPAWSADGRTLAYRTPEGIFVARADGSSARRVTRISTAFALTPDAKTIVISRVLPDKTPRNFSIRPDLVAVNVATGRERRIGYDGERPAISPDGRTVAFMDDQRTNPRRYQSIGVVGVNGRHRHILYKHGSPEGLDWSPDGKRLAWVQSACTGRCTKLKLMTFRGHRVRTLLRRPAGPEGTLSGGGISWSPAGGRIAAGEWDGVSADRIVMVDASTGKVTRPPTEQLGVEPAWQPLK